MGKKTTIYDIAKKLNITAATVSRALNDNPRVSQATKELVVKTAAEMNYEQNRLALALKSGKSMNVGVIVPYINRNFFSTIIRGIEEELYPMGYHVIICQTHDEAQREKDTVQNLLNAQVDGILMSLATDSEGEEHFKQVLKKKVPLIFFDRKKNMTGASSVCIDDYQGGFEATQHLIDQGSRRIAHLAVNRSLEVYKNRFEGYKKALKRNGLEFNEDYVIELESDFEAGKEAAEKLMQLDPPPDAIFSATDHGALGAIKYIKSIGVKIPEQVCVVGFSNEPFTQFMEQSISSVDQSPLEMGKKAARVFLEQLEQKGKEKIVKEVVLTPKLEIRQSSLRNI